LKERLKQLVSRVCRPALRGIETRLERIDERLGALEGILERRAGVALDRDKYREELDYWRWLIKTDEGRASLYAPFEVAFGEWQRDRLRELASCLGLAGPGARGAALDLALDEWCESQSVVEIGAGPYPAVAAAPRWRRAVAVDPIARGYAEEGLLPEAAGHVTYLEAPGERVPLPAGFADLVIIENALDHVSDPAAVLTEIRRLLGDGGLLWLLVDLSTYSDHMHPHPFDEMRIKGLLRQAGFEPVKERVSDHKSHPKAYGEYRGLLRKPGNGAGVEGAAEAAAAPA
jgi:SAM-dependent methyltransferase